MKTSCTRQANLSTTELLKRSLLLITAMLALAALNVVAQPTPLSVPAGGIGPLTFDTLPGLANGWAARAVPGGNGDTTSMTKMDTDVETNSVAFFTAALGTDANATPPEGSGSTSGSFRWNSARFFLESRPTGVTRAELLLALRNDSGGDKSTIILNYTFGIDNNGLTVSEDAGLYGYRVYYSLTGAPTTWVHIPEFDSPDGGGDAGTKAVTLTLPSPWEAGANLYFLWTDDNGVPASTGTTSPIEGPYTIDNLQLTFQVDPVAIVTPPHSATVEQCRKTNFTVVASGTSPQYQWLKNGNIISGATSATLTISNAQASDAGNYSVRVYNSKPSSIVTSPVSLTVTPDAEDPTVVSALAKVDGTNIIVVFSEPMFVPSIHTFDFTLVPEAGGNTASPSAATLASDGITLTLSFDDPRTPNTNYKLYADPNIADACAQRTLAGDLGDFGIIVLLKYEIHFMSFENTAWKYNHEGVDLFTDWRLDPGYDDSSWSNGVSVLDAKSTPRTTVGGMNVMTQLPLRNSTFVDSNIPCYYFRGHFTLPVPPSEVSALSLRTFVDDFDVGYMNNYAVPIRVNPGNPLTDLNTYGYSGGNAVGDAGILGPFKVNPTNLVAGDNLVCVKLFQQAGTSSDITFAYELVGVIDSFPAAGPSLAISQSAGTVTITWTDASATLYEASSVDATGGAWTVVSGAGAGSYSFSAGTAAGQKFYTLRR